ncbi:YgaP family membrane protein [Bacillus sp. AK128]
MKPNIGIINALVRLSCGFTMLAWATARMARKPHRERYFLVAMLASMKIGMGILRFCPFTYLYQNSQQQQDSSQQEQREDFTSNPT